MLFMTDEYRSFNS